MERAVEHTQDGEEERGRERVRKLKQEKKANKCRWKNEEIYYYWFLERNPSDSAYLCRMSPWHPWHQRFPTMKNSLCAKLKLPKIYSVKENINNNRN
jgi:hypothetical protein